jgi:hypothetical protein
MGGGQALEGEKVDNRLLGILISSPVATLRSGSVSLRKGRARVGRRPCSGAGSHAAAAVGGSLGFKV